VASDTAGGGARARRRSADGTASARTARSEALMA
jgi:hypothetical protein